MSLDCLGLMNCRTVTAQEIRAADRRFVNPAHTRSSLRRNVEPEGIGVTPEPNSVSSHAFQGMCPSRRLRSDYVPSGQHGKTVRFSICALELCRHCTSTNIRYHLRSS